jgi:hypothetical protein
MIRVAVVVALIATTGRVRPQAKGNFEMDRINGNARSIGPGFFSGPFVPDPDLDLPADSTIDQQIAAGKKELAKFQQTEPTLDHDEEFAAYVKDIASRLLAAQDIRPPYPIEVHVSTGPTLNAFGGPGGQILFHSQMVDQANTEAQMVAIVAHEMSHELHDDFAFFWKAAKAGEDSYGQGGLLEQSHAIEARADREAAHMMYNARWNPKAETEMMMRIVKLYEFSVRDIGCSIRASGRRRSSRRNQQTDRDAAAERRADRRLAAIPRAEETAVGATARSSIVRLQRHPAARRSGSTESNFVTADAILADFPSSDGKRVRGESI